MDKEKYKSMTMLAGSMLIFSTIGIFRRFIPLSSGLLAFTRGILGSLFLIVWVKIKGGKLKNGLSKRDLFLLIFSGALIGLNWIFLFEAYNYTTVSVATLCYYMEPTIVILLSPLFFKEKLTLKKIVCVLVSLVGMALVAGLTDIEGLTFKDGKGILFGLIAAFLYAFVVITSKKVKADEPFEKTIIELSSAALVLVPYLLLTEDLCGLELSVRSLLMVLITGIVHTGFAYLLYFGSLKGLKSQSVALMSYIDPIGALLCSAIILKERLTAIFLFGAVLIIGAAIISEIETK